MQRTQNPPWVKTGNQLAPVRDATAQDDSDSDMSWMSYSPVSSDDECDTFSEGDESECFEPTELDLEPDAELDLQPDAELDLEPDAELDLQPDDELDLEPDAELDLEADAELDLESNSHESNPGAYP